MRRIKARVIRNIGTESKWLEKNPVLGDGEMALVRFGGRVRQKIGNGSLRFSDLSYQDNDLKIPAIDTSFPFLSGEGAAPEGIYFAKESGTYQPGNVEVDTSGKMVMLVWDGVGELEKVETEMPEPVVNGEIAEGDDRAASGDTIIKFIGDVIIPCEFVSPSLDNWQGLYTSSGNKSKSQNWISTDELYLDDGVYYIEGGEDKNLFIKVYDPDKNLIDDISVNPSGSFFNLDYPNLDHVVINIASGSNIANQIDAFNVTLRIGGCDGPTINADRIKGVINTEQIIDIQNKLDDVNSVSIGMGCPTSKNYGDIYHNISDNSIFVRNINNELVSSDLISSYPVVVDNEIKEDIPFPVYRRVDGSYYIKWRGVFNEFVKEDHDRMVKYYISPDGDDSNDGLSSDRPVRTFDRLMALGARNIEVQSGVFDRNNRFPLISDDGNSSDPFIIIGVGEVVFTSGFPAKDFNWVQDENIYTTARSNVTNITDLKFEDDAGRLGQLYRAGSVQDCKDTDSSFYISGGSVYINIGREPDESVYLQTGTGMGYVSNNANCPYFYMENMTILNSHSDSALRVENTSGIQHNTKAILNKIKIFNNESGNGIGINNIKETYIEGCYSGNHRRDSYNYHTTNPSFSPILALETNTYSYNTGVFYDGEYSSNGSTIHDGGSIVRVQCKYDGGTAVVADVNEGTLSINFGVESANAIHDSQFKIHGSNALMYLFGCIAHSKREGIKSLRALNGAKAYYDKHCLMHGEMEGDLEEM